MSRDVEIDYTNWRGERRRRVVIPRTFYYGVSPYHEGEQWLMDALDVDSGLVKTFAVSGLGERAWVPADEQAQVAEPAGPGEGGR